MCGEYVIIFQYFPYLAIQQSNIPCVIAINKIDRQSANIERTKASLLEHGIYVEGMGGDTPAVPISAKVGTGIPDLLDTLLLVADVAELTGDESMPAEGVVIESERDPKKGIAATLLIKNGTLRAGDIVLAGTALAPVRIFEDFAGTTIKKATFSSPVRVVGFDTLPHAGALFRAFSSKKDAETARSAAAVTEARYVEEQEDDRFVVPVVIKAEANGSIEGIVHELKKIENDRTRIKVILSGIGAISESDIKTAVASPGTLVVGFNVPVDTIARDMADNNDITIRTFSIIYELADYVRDCATNATPKQKQDNIEGTAQVFKVFSSRKDTYTIGGKVLSGTLFVGHQVKVLRNDAEVTRGKLATLQVNKSDATRADEGALWGAQVELKDDIVEGDTLVCFTTIET
jgi:translation initiation factor IF-2